MTAYKSLSQSSLKVDTEVGFRVASRTKIQITMEIQSVFNELRNYLNDAMMRILIHHFFFLLNCTLMSNENLKWMKIMKCYPNKCWAY